MVESIPEVFRDAFVLKVRLAIQVLRLNVADALFLCALHHDHVGWEELVLLHLDKVTDLHVTPSDVFKALLAFVESRSERVVFLRIFTMPAVIFIRILAHRGEDDEDEGRKHRRLST